MRVIEVVQRSATFLESRGVESPRLQVELILAHVLRIPRLQIYLQFEKVLTADLLDAIRSAVQRRGQRVPLQHIVGSTSFCGFEIEVSPDVLIPRPETELLAEHAWTWLSRHAPDSPLVLDWGTGSGCLAIAIAGNHPSARVTAIDISPACLDIARRNATRHSLSNRIEFLHTDGVESLPTPSRFHLIVGNPPYIPTEEIPTLEPEVRDHDPTLALDGGSDGLDLYRRLALTLRERLLPAGTLMLEFGEGQAPALSKILTAAQWAAPQIHADHSGRDRFLVTHFPNSTPNS